MLKRWSGFEHITKRLWKLISITLVLTVIGVHGTWPNWSDQAPRARTLSPRPRLIIDDSVAADFEGLARETWDEFLNKFQARSDCFGDVRLIASYDLKDKATYNPEHATVTVRVPGSPALLQSALVHEWAHHIEFQCAEHQELIPAFLTVLEMPLVTPWYSTNSTADISMSTWKEIPSEQYAEATVAFVLGERQIPSHIIISDEAVHLVAEWAAGGKP